MVCNIKKCILIDGGCNSVCTYMCVMCVYMCVHIWLCMCVSAQYVAIICAYVCKCECGHVHLFKRGYKVYRQHFTRVVVQGRGCCDMIFVAWQLLEKAREQHQDTLYTLC